MRVEGQVKNLFKKPNNPTKRIKYSWSRFLVALKMKKSSKKSPVVGRAVEKTSDQIIVESLNSSIVAIQRSTRTTFKFLVPLHERLRQRSRCYYHWHLNKYASLVHGLILILVIICTAVVSFTMLMTTEKSYATGSSVAVVDNTAGANVLNTGGKIYFSTGGYGSNVVIDNYSRQMSGYAWSSDLGWIDFGGGADNPSGPVIADASGRPSGKAKALNSGYIDFNSTLTGANVMISGGNFSGYAWSDDLGWVDFSQVSAPSYNPDLLPPDNPSVAAKSTSGGVTLTSGNWYNYPTPYFSWTTPTDYASGITPSGVAGYYVYFGTSGSADPSSYQTDLNFTSANLGTSYGTYYFRVKTIDVAGNVSAAATLFTYNYRIAAATNATIGNLAPTTFDVTWTDNSSDETGFKVFVSISPNADCSLATYPYSPDYTAAANSTTQSVTGKSINNQYCAKVVATDYYNDSSPAYSTPTYTQANTPSAPTVNTPTISSLKVIINQNSNPTGTQYAIWNDTTSQYIQANGTLGASAVWQDYTTWGGASGIVNTGLSSNTSYPYKVKAENGDNIETAFSVEASASTLATPPSTPAVTPPTDNSSTTSPTDNEQNTPANPENGTSNSTTEPIIPNAPAAGNLVTSGYNLVIKVVDTNGKPVKGAKVSIHSAVQEAISDENGIVDFKNVESGDHNVVIAYNNYVAQQTINLSGDTKNISITVTLQPDNSLFRKYWIIIGSVSLLLILSLLFIIFRAKSKNAHRSRN